MNELEELFRDAGLGATEAKVYLTGLGYESIDVKELAKQTSIKRPTIYHALSTLAEKGLVASRGTGAKLAFVMSPPEHLKAVVSRELEALRSRERSIEKLTSLLSAQSERKKKERISTVQYEGVEGVKAVVETALYCRSRRWDIIAPRTNFFSEFDKEYARYYLEARRRRGIVSRSLWENEPGRRALGPEELRERQPRFLPASMRGRFKEVIILFDDKVAIVSSLEKVSAILIVSPEVHQTFTAIFETLWSVSEEYSAKRSASRPAKRR